MRASSCFWVQVASTQMFRGQKVSRFLESWEQGGAKRQACRVYVPADGYRCAVSLIRPQGRKAVARSGSVPDGLYLIRRMIGVI